MKSKIMDIFIYAIIVFGVFFLAFSAQNFLPTSNGAQSPEAAAKAYIEGYPTFGKADYEKYVKDFYEHEYNRMLDTRKAYHLKKAKVDKTFAPVYQDEYAVVPVFMTFGYDDNGTLIERPQYTFILTIKYKKKWFVLEKSQYPDGFQGLVASVSREYEVKKEFVDRQKINDNISNKNKKFFDKADKVYDQLVNSN